MLTVTNKKREDLLLFFYLNFHDVMRNDRISRGYNFS